MDDPAGENKPADAAWLAGLLAGGRHRWHAAPEDGSLFVLDDGTGDVELRVRSAGGGLQATLLRRDEEAERFDVPRAPEAAEAFRARLEEAVERLSRGPSREGGKGKTRFIVSFEAGQLARLRSLADGDGVPVAEVVRRAVDEYLAGRNGSPRIDGGPVG